MKNQPKIEDNTFRTFIDDEEDISFRYMLATIYTNNAYHVNIHGPKHIDDAKTAFGIIKEAFPEKNILSFNEGHFAGCIST